jgi:hypothetical protein
MERIREREERVRKKEEGLRDCKAKIRRKDETQRIV